MYFNFQCVILILFFYRDLNLAGNPIQRIPKGGFEFVPQLVKLDLSRCQLVEIDPQAFAHLKLLESLKISSNRLTSLNNHTVSDNLSCRIHSYTYTYAYNMQSLLTCVRGSVCSDHLFSGFISNKSHSNFADTHQLIIYCYFVCVSAKLLLFL